MTATKNNNNRQIKCPVIIFTQSEFLMNMRIDPKNPQADITNAVLISKTIKVTLILSKTHVRQLKGKTITVSCNEKHMSDYTIKLDSNGVLELDIIETISETGNQVTFLQVH